MKNYHYYFFDLDGTLLCGKALIPYAKELVQELYHRGNDVYFLTNHPVSSREVLATNLNKIGLELNCNQLITPVLALGEYLDEGRREGISLYIVGSEMIKQELEQMGFHILKSVTDKSRGKTYVVLGMAPSITYPELQEGFSLLQQGADLILLNRDMLCPSSEGFLIDTGSLARVLDHPDIVKGSEVVGKPSRWMQKVLLKKIAEEKGRAVIIGDSLPSDIAIGNALGIDTVLVQSGVTSEKDLIGAKEKPLHTCRSVKDIYDTLRSNAWKGETMEN